MMPYPSLIPYVWYPIDVSRERADVAAPPGRTLRPDHARAVARSDKVAQFVRPRAGVVRRVGSAVVFLLAHWLRRVRQAQRRMRILSVKMQGQTLQAQCNVEGGPRLPS